MLVSELITKLNYSELKQLNIGSDDTACISMINDGILEIYKRFNLWQAEATITIAADKYIYALDGVDADVSIDLSDKVLLHIEEIYNADGDSLGLNDENDTDGLTPATPYFNQVEFIEITAGDVYSVIYRAAPIPLTLTTDVVPIPPPMQEALMSYIGFRAHTGQDGHEALENNTHWKRFKASCDRVDFLGLIAQDSMVSHKFDNNIFP